MWIWLVKKSLSGNITKQNNSAFMLMAQPFPVVFSRWALAVGKRTALSLAAVAPSCVEHPATWHPREKAEAWEQGPDFFSQVKQKIRNSSPGWKAEVGAGAWQHCSENWAGLNSHFYIFLWPLIFFFFCAITFLQHPDFANSVWYQSRKFCQGICVKA